MAEPTEDPADPENLKWTRRARGWGYCALPSFYDEISPDVTFALRPIPLHRTHDLGIRLVLS